MEWIEASVSTTSEGVEPVFGVLLSCGVTGAQIVDHSEMAQFLNSHPLTWDYVDETLVATDESPAQVIFYVTPGPAGQETLSQVRACLHTLKQSDMGFSLGELSVHCDAVDDETWLNEWKKYYKPFRIGRSVVIRPVWELYEKQPGDVVFHLEPGSVFGTGLHQTTQLCIEALEQYTQSGHRVLDIGCGSGILSVISMLLGASYAFACDFDPAAALAAQDNVLRNPVDAAQYKVRTGDILTDASLRAEIGTHAYDIVLANIVADVVIGLAPMVNDFLKPGGVFIASGIITERADEVRQAMTGQGLTVREVREKDGWYCMVYREDKADA